MPQLIINSTFNLWYNDSPRYILILLFLLVSGLSSAQELQSSIRGTIADKEQTLPGATVMLLHTKDTLVISSTVSDAKGAYSFSGIKAGSYRILVTCMGYNRLLSSDFEVAKSQTVDMKVLLIEPSLTQLKEVNISSYKSNVEMKNGKLVYNVEHSASAGGSSALDLLRRTPGVNVDHNENLMLKGSTSVNVMLDGKMTYLSAQQLSNMLKGMTAEQISHIEVIAAPSAQYDAAGNAGIINIVTRKSNKDGYAANISSGVTLGRYLLNNHNITGNIKTNKLNVFGNLGYSYRQSYSDDNSRQLTNTNNTAAIFDRTGNTVRTSFYYSYKAGLDLYLSKAHQIGFVYNGSVDDWSKNTEVLTYIHQGEGQPTSSLRSRNYSKEPYYNHVFNLNYKYNLDTTGKVLTADADYISYRNNSDGYLSSNAYNGGESQSQPYQRVNFHQPSNIEVRSVKADLDLPYKMIKIKAGLKYSDVHIDNNFRYDSLQNGTYVYAAALSDHFVYKEQIGAAYISVGKQWKGISLDAGLRLEHTFASGNSISTGVNNERNYTDIFPSLGVTAQLDERSKLDLSFSRRINRPNYGNLNPARYFSDKYAYYQGNPNLIAEKAWIGSLSYTLLDKYIASFSYNRANNFIAKSVTVDPATNTMISSNANYSHKDRWEMQVIAPFHICSFWDLNTSAILSYTQYPLVQQRGFEDVSKTAVDLFASQTFHLPGATTLEVMTRYTSPELNGVYTERYYFSMDGGVRKSFLKKRLDARFSFADLFHTGWYWGYSISDHVNYTYKNLPDSQRFNITLTYHLGGKLFAGKAHQIEEQKRLK